VGLPLGRTPRRSPERRRRLKRKAARVSCRKHCRPSALQPLWADKPAPSWTDGLRLQAAVSPRGRIAHVVVGRTNQEIARAVLVTVERTDWSYRKLGCDLDGLGRRRSTAPRRPRTVFPIRAPTPATDRDGRIGDATYLMGAMPFPAGAIDRTCGLGRREHRADVRLPVHHLLEGQSLLRRSCRASIRMGGLMIVTSFGPRIGAARRDLRASVMGARVPSEALSAARSVSAQRMSPRPQRRARSTRRARGRRA
jgi:hypothetical protein